jgi:hypothetical protein
MYKLLLILLVVLPTRGYAKLSVEEVITKMRSIDVLLLSDHTLPGHLNLSSGGANGIEREFIDPAIVVARDYMQAQGLSSYILNVEDMLSDKQIIKTKQEFDLAYGNYDKVLEAAVANKVTIISLHFDADIIMAEDYQEGTTYIGGAQIILDARNVSPASFKLSYFMLHDYKLLESLNQAGFRIRPDYENAIRYQPNQTLHIIGGSPGGAFLLELAAQDQAIRLYRDAKGTAEALRPSLQILAKGIEGFRRQMGLKLIQ